MRSAGHFLLFSVLAVFLLLLSVVECTTSSATTTPDARWLIYVRWQHIDTDLLSSEHQQLAINQVVDYIRDNLSVIASVEKIVDSIGITPNGQMRTIARVGLTLTQEQNVNKRETRNTKPLTTAKALQTLRLATTPIKQNLMHLYMSIAEQQQQSNRNKRTLLGYQGIRGTPNVEIMVEEDRRIELFDRQFKPYAASGTIGQANVVPWHLDRINQKTLPLDGQDTIASALLTGPSDSWIYIIDTGIYAAHPEFTDANGNSRVTLISNQYPTQPVDCDVHGTHVASLVGGNTVGVNPNSSIFDARTLDCTGSAYWSDILAAVASVLQHCTANGGNTKRSIVVNMSLGGPGDPADPAAASMATELYDLRTQCDAVIVAAAGNSAGSTCMTLPAGYVSTSQGGVLAIGATASNDAFAYFSNNGPCVVIDSPGVSITGASNTGGYAVLSGTSMASPIVAGVASLHAKQRPADWSATTSLFTDHIREKILSDSVPVVSGTPTATTNDLIQVTSMLLNPATPIAPVTTSPLPSPASSSNSSRLNYATIYFAFGALLLLHMIVLFL